MSRTHIFVITSALALLLYVLDLVRRRRLKEDYSWLWLILALACLLLAVWPELAVWLAQLLGSKNPLSALVFPALYLLILILIQVSTRLSRLATQNKNLAQLVGILDSELRAIKDALASGGSTDQSAQEQRHAQRPDR